MNMRTAVKALVVVVVLLLAGGLGVCAIVKLREAAARTQCGNNLKQIGLALLNYQGTINRFPAAARPNPDLPPERRLSWVVEIVPYAEADRIYSKLAREKGWDAEENRFAALLPMRYLRCPSYPERPPVSTLVPTHYLGASGIGPDAVSLPAGAPGAGFFGYERKLTLADLQRPAADVLMVIETSDASGAWTAAGPPTVRGLDPSRPPYLGGNGTFGGNHPGGANAAFADGSVRFLSDQMSPRELEALVTIKPAQEGE
jgi:prepilin-type processing-associated H-X9-DG protein